MCSGGLGQPRCRQLRLTLHLARPLASTRRLLSCLCLLRPRLPQLLFEVSNLSCGLGSPQFLEHCSALRKWFQRSLSTASTPLSLLGGGGARGGAGGGSEVRGYGWGRVWEFGPASAL